MRSILAVLFILFAGALNASAYLSIQYNDGIPEDGIWLGDGRGHAVLFSPPDNWTLSKIAVCGMLNSDGIFILEVWDKDLNLIHRTTDLAGAYFGRNLSWAEIDIPDVKLNDTFFIVLFEFSTIFVGIDENTTLNRSFLAGRNPNVLLNQLQEGEWMIAALGQVSSRPPSIKASHHDSPDGVSIEAIATDPDGDLTGVSLYIIDNESNEVVWMDNAAASGNESEARFLWPRAAYSVSNGSESIFPVVAVEVKDIDVNISRYLRYSAPCLLNITDAGPYSDALAYFGEDYELHALESTDGFIHYLSEELFKAIRPGARYSDYIRNNITIIEGRSSLRFLSMGETLKLHRPLYLTRSPLHHYDLRLKKEAAKSNYTILLVASDVYGNTARSALPM